MNHRKGTDPTPQGRTPDVVRRRTQTPPEGYISERYENSAPGPDVRKDGAYFFGYKREGVHDPEPEAQPSKRG